MLATAINDQSSIFSKATRLSVFLSAHPEILAYLHPEKADTPVKTKAKVGEKVHSAKPTFAPPVDFVATEAKVDLDIALRRNDVPNIRKNYYQLAKLIGWSSLGVK